jgi:thioredoxin 1
MKKENIIKTVIVVIVILSVVGIFVYKNSINKEEKLNKQETKKTEDVSIYSEEEKLPTLLEFGSTTCEPCQIMEPIIDSIEKKYEGKVIVKFINVYTDSNSTLTNKYNIRTIPTQIFLDADGKNMYRHEGILYEDEIIKKLSEMGIN